MAGRTGFAKVAVKRLCRDVLGASAFVNKRFGGLIICRETR